MFLNRVERVDYSFVLDVRWTGANMWWVSSDKERFPLTKTSKPTQLLYIFAFALKNNRLFWEMKIKENKNNQQYLGTLYFEPFQK